MPPPAESSPTIEALADARAHHVRDPGPRITLVVARAHNGVIGVDGRLPWHIPEELQHFRALTMHHPIVMGRRTWESINRVLPGRRSIVITRDERRVFDTVERAASFDEAIAIASRRSADPTIATDEAFVIGGAEIFAIARPLATRAVVTEIDIEVAGDTHFEALDPKAWRIEERSEHRSTTGVRYTIIDYRRIPAAID